MYSATTITEGELIRASIGISTTKAVFISSGGGGSSAGVDALGVSNQTITTTSSFPYGGVSGSSNWGSHVSTAATTTTPAIASIADTVATGCRYGVAIINPFAVYLMEYDQSALAVATAAADSATTTYTQTVEQYMDGGWLYLANGSTTADDGQLRYISVSTSTTSYTLLTAMTSTSSDKIISIYPVNHAITGVSAAGSATLLSRLTSMSAGSGVSHLIMENYIESGYDRPMERLRQPIHDGIQDAGAKFYADVLQIDHIYNQST
jgi:hypothetical protein